jgi:hypothetical protein
MANFNQLADLPITGGGTITCKNYGGTDIPAGTGVLADTTNVQGSNAAPGVVVPTAAGGVAGTFGIAMETIPAGKNGRVMYAGGYPMIADGAITAGNFVQISDTATKMGRVKLCGAATIQIGRAVGSAADGDPVLVIIDIAKNS